LSYGQPKVCPADCLIVWSGPDLPGSKRRPAPLPLGLAHGGGEILQDGHPQPSEGSPMVHRRFPGSWPCLLAALWAAGTLHAHAQVHRCGESNVYTDKPCHDARPVDLRANILDAGPRFMPVVVPAPAVIPPSASEPKTSESGGGDVWQRRAARDAEHRARTGPYGP
jgi:hypothetical protein